MKKIIGWLGAHICFCIGNLFSKLSYYKTKKGFYFDSRKKVGNWLATNYQRWMDYSCKIQDWAKLSSPWKEIK